MKPVAMALKPGSASYYVCDSAVIKTSQILSWKQIILSTEEMRELK